MEKIFVNFSFDGKLYEAEKGTLLSKICEEAGYAQDLVCGGNGKCGKCAVEIVSGGTGETVLSCQYEVQNDITVMKIHNMAGRKVNVLTANSELICGINPMLGILRVKGRDIAAEHCGSFMGTIAEKYKLKAAYPALKKLSRMASMNLPDATYDLITYKNEIIDICEGDNEGAIYGMAIDIGSTTVAGYLYNMNDATLIDAYSSLNGQTALGADVISRIGYCIKNEDGTAVMQQKVVETINKLIAQAKAEKGIDESRIYHVVLCGNSTMEHLFLGLYPENLGKAPFVSATHDFVEIDGKDSGLRINENAKITFLPLLGGFVGADTTAVLIGIPDDDKPRLVIDLGTNGELAVGTDERYIIASTACGPALEGAGLSCGMRAAAGAIEHFTIGEDKNFTLQVIGNEKPTGICGSGIIDILAELLRNGVINQRGKMLSQAEYEKKYGECPLSRRLIKVEDKNAFLLASEEESGSGMPVYFSQMDARQIQLAKAAIATGCNILVENYGIQPEDLHEICLAGAFGNYLDVDNAQFIGLFPKFEGVPVRSIGNGAGTGVQMFMLDQTIVKKCYKVQKNAEHTELNFQEDFKDTYFDQMLFKNASK